MNITLGVYDLFAYAVPGSLYLALLGYIAERLRWVDPSRILHANTVLVVIAGLILSYLIGHITYQVGYLLSRAYGHDKTIMDARSEFVKKIPTVQDRPLLQAHRSVLTAAIEMHETGAATEIARLRAIGLMLRNSAPVFVLASIVAIVEVIIGDHPIIAGCCTAIFLLFAVGCLSQSVVMRHWANMKTFELAYWVPDIDRGLGAASAPTKQSQHPDPSAPDQQVRNLAASTPQRSRRRTGRSLGTSSQSPPPHQ
jgi:hypothetical protein